MRTPAVRLRAATLAAAAGLLVPTVLATAVPAGATAAPRATTAATTTTLTPGALSSTTDVPNPQRGQYTWMGSAPQPSSAVAPDQYDRDRTYWGRLEPTKGQYDFSAIDAGLAAAGAVKGKYSFRVMAYCPGCWMEYRSDWPSVVPSWMPKDSDGVPSWNSETFLARWEALWAEIGRRYGDDPRLGSVDVGGFGAYGEWTPAGANVTEAGSRRIVAAVASALPTKHVLLSTVLSYPVSGIADGRAPYVLEWALDTYPNLGMRSDCLGNPYMQKPENTAAGDMTARWKTRPFFTEWCSNGEPTLGLSQVRSTHVSTVSSGNRRLAYADMTSAQKSDYTALLAASGYRYGVASATVGTLDPGRPASLSLSLRNSGVAPTYDRWTTRLVLKDASGSRVATVPLTLDLRTRLPGTTTFSQTITTPSVPAGSYDLGLEVVDPAGYSAPMRLANTGRAADGSYLLGSVTVGDLGTSTPSVVRLAGANRYESSADISRATFAPGVPVAFVATGENFPDALSAAPAGGSLGGPVLLVKSSALPPSIADELARLRPQRIVVLGGAGSVGDGVLRALRTYAPDVSRIAGPTRYATSAAISRATFAAGVDVAYVATGATFPDALSAAPAGGKLDGPVLLVRPDAVPDEAATELARLAPHRIVVLGGSGSVSKDVLQRLGTWSSSVTRLSGPNRYDTSAAISAATVDPGVPVAYVATGETFPDALSGAPAAGSVGGPVLLVRSTSIPDAIRAELSRLRPGRIVVLGGSGSVSSGVASQLTAYAGTTP